MAAWWTVMVILGGSLMAFSAYAAITGGIGAVGGARYERCPKCGHHGLVIRGTLHPFGCPPSPVLRLAHAVYEPSHGGHYRHY